jgi:hypothetical protein
MNIKYKAIISVVAGATILAGVILPVAMPEQTKVYAKWFNRTSSSDKIEAENAVTVLSDSQPEEQKDEIPAEVIVDTKDGQTERVVIQSEQAVSVVVAIDKAVTEALQEAVGKGDKVWLLDPVKVVQNNAANYGFDAERDTFTLVSQVYKSEKSGTGGASVLVKHSNKYYLVKLTQPTGSGVNKIWQVSSIKEVRVITTVDKGKDNKVDVGPGVEGLDYDKVVKWQQNVDAGRELWRLDPLKVAKMEGRNYGFSDNDSYTIIRKLNSSAIARHGQIDVEVNHDDKLYTMIIVRPFGGGDAIWTTYKVIGKKPPVITPAPNPAEKVLFQTDKFVDWKWQKGSYPKDMAFATVVDYEGQLKNDHRIPEAALLKLKDVDFSKKVALFAYLGSSSGGHGIGIEKVTMSGNTMTVQVRAKSPRPGDMVTMMLTYPSDFILIDRNIVDVWGGVNVTFVDQQGQVLSKNKLTITHH